MTLRYARILNKSYLIIGPIEFQYGHLRHSLGFHFRHRWHSIFR